MRTVEESVESAAVELSAAFERDLVVTDRSQKSTAAE